jgi:hypothetical protein
MVLVGMVGMQYMLVVERLMEQKEQEVVVDMKCMHASVIRLSFDIMQTGHHTEFSLYSVDFVIVGYVPIIIKGFMSYTLLNSKLYIT